MSAVAPANRAVVHRRVKRARRGVAMFVRTTQIEGSGRWRNVFRPHPPAIVAQFVERVPLHSGRWEPDGDTLTAYCWIVWKIGGRANDTRLVWIPPCRGELHYARDVERFGAAEALT